MNNITNYKPFEVQFDFAALPDNKPGEKVYMYEWLKNDGEWVDEGQPLYRIRIGDYLGSFMCYTSQPLTAIKSGIVQHLKQKDDTIQNEEAFYIIYPKGVYAKENTPLNTNYFFYFDKFKYEIPEKYSHHEINIKQWHKEDGQLVNEKELVLSLGYSNTYGNNECLLHYAEKSGYFNRVRSQLDFMGLKQTELVYVIHGKDEDRIKRKFFNIPDIKVDDFTKKKIIKWSYVGGVECMGKGITSQSDDRNTSLTFTFNNEDEKDFIAFQFLSKQFMLSKDDIISFLFENERKIDFVLNLNSYKIATSASEKYFENKILITGNELQHFEEFNLNKWKIIIKKQNREIIGGVEGVNAYKSKTNLTTAIRKFAKEYRELIRTEIPNYVPLLERRRLDLDIQSNASEECYVYLMIDTINNYHKIGISNKPVWREKTLQSEKPTIELLASKRFVSRRIASSFEKALHDSYAEKRIRGEWFKLNMKDVSEIKITLNG